MLSRIECNIQSNIGEDKYVYMASSILCMCFFSLRLCEINWPKSPILFLHFQRIRSLFFYSLFSGTYDFCFILQRYCLKCDHCQTTAARVKQQRYSCYFFYFSSTSPLPLSLSNKTKNCEKFICCASKTSVCHSRCAVALSLHFIYFPISSPST